MKKILRRMYHLKVMLLSYSTMELVSMFAWWILFGTLLLGGLGSLIPWFSQG